MSQKTTPSKAPIVKLTLPVTPSNHTSQTSPTKDFEFSPVKAKKVIGSPVKMRMNLQSPTSTAVTNPKTLSPSPKKNITGSLNSTRNGLLSRSATVRLEKSTISEKSQPKTPSTKERRKSYLPSLEMTVSEIKEKLYKVFQFYTSFGERSNVGYLKNNRFTKMMVDAEVRSDLLSQSTLDLLFVGELKHSGNLDFDKFLSLLTKVAAVKYVESANESEALELLLKEHMFPLFERIFKDLENTENGKIHEPILESTKLVMNSIGTALEIIFSMYFPFEIQTGQDPQVVKQRLENALFIFLREFNIYPALINKGTAYAIWNDVLRANLETAENGNNTEQNKEKKPKGKTNDKAKDLPFGLERFKMFLVRVANLAYQDQVLDSGAKMPQPERVVQLLDRMDFAFKVLNNEKKVAPFGGSFSLLVSKDTLNKIYDYIKTIEEKQGSEVVDNGKPAKEVKGVVVTSGTKYEMYDISDEGVIRLFEKYFGPLIKIFQYYCSFGEPLNIRKLHAFKFTKLLREAGILQMPIPVGGTERFFRILKGVPLPPEGETGKLLGAEADIVVASLTGPKTIREFAQKQLNHDPNVETPFIGFLNYLYKNNPLNLVTQGRLDYEAFLKSIEMIAGKLFPDMPLAKAVTQLLEKHLLKLETEVTEIKKMVGSQPLKLLVDMLQNSEMVDLLGVLHKSITSFYQSYADSKGMMNIERFMQFCKDFSIFPDLISKGKLCTFFNSLAGVRSQAEATNALQTMDGTPTKPQLKKSKSQGKAVEQTEDDLIDQHMFVEALALCAVELPYLNPQPTDMQKIFNFLEKINQSQGPNIVKSRMGSKKVVVGSAWDLMHDFKIKYPEFFKEPVLDEEEVAAQQTQ